MLSNFHTHTKYCDGANTAEEMVLSAIEKGFDTLGFSGHGYTAHDHTYCMMETEKYLAEVNSLKEKYKGKIEIYAGVEEDITHILDRSQYDYILGSSHYFLIDGKYYPVDSNPKTFELCYELFGKDTHKMAEQYYSTFCDYILKRKPDIVGHFDLITKFDENASPMFFGDKKYEEIAEKYLLAALKSDCIFEVNTGAISRGYKKYPYPQMEFLKEFKNCGFGAVITTDCHDKNFIDCHYNQSKELLLAAGFKTHFVLTDNGFAEQKI